MWQRHGSVYGAKSARKDAAADPYQALAEAVAKERRQELFSFAAANCLEVRAATDGLSVTHYDIKSLVLERCASAETTQLGLVGRALRCC